MRERAHVKGHARGIAAVVIVVVVVDTGAEARNDSVAPQQRVLDAGCWMLERVYP